MAPRQLREQLFEALKSSSVFEALRETNYKSYVKEGIHFKLSELDMDSLARMEFCIAIELSLGVTLLPAQLVDLDSTDAIERFIVERLG